MTPETPVFEAPWHGQLFALTVALNEAGHFDWSEWADRFGATLAHRGLSRVLDGGDDYFSAWLETLESFLSDKALSDPREQAAVRRAWEAAFLRTPHGEPVNVTWDDATG